uniref:Uncharacterized protein n=1 Tax=Anguilla anguilla TaxID=7936 RepID=A0A0E9TE34_ANGAN
MGVLPPRCTPTRVNVNMAPELRWSKHYCTNKRTK